MTVYHIEPTEIEVTEYTVEEDGVITYLPIVPQDNKEN